VTLLDALLILVIVVAVVRGWRAGLARQAFSVAFFVGGLVLGALLAPWLAGQVDGERAKVAVTIVAVLGTAIGVGMLGEALGSALGSGLRRIKLGGVDAILGAGFGLVGSVLLIWLFAGMLASVPLGGLGTAIHDSTVISAVQDRLPPSPPLIARIERFLDPLGFPRVFAGLEPDLGPRVEGPSTTAVESAIQSASPSTLRIEGDGCGGRLTGSGFAAGPDLVITNAHVVAGTDNITVDDGQGRRAAAPVTFDPDTDLAVLRVEGLDATPLPLALEVAPRGTGGAILGYPGGGGLRASGAAVLDATQARGRDIYNRDLTTRSIYVLQGAVRPGNSGGPFVLPDGRVAGVVFARSLTDDGVAYALNVDEVVDDLQVAAGSTQPVSTGPCAAD
jgi:S1-C subfamily serine protease